MNHLTNNQLLPGSPVFHTIPTPIIPPQQITPIPTTESIIHFLGFDWTLNTVVQITLASIAIFTLLFIAYQSYLSRKAHEVSALHMRYSMILENNKFIFEHPEFVKLSMGPRRYPLVMALNNDERKRLAAYELLLDNFEFYFLVGSYEDRKHSKEFAKLILKNPSMKAFLASDYAGTFRKKFQDIIDEELKTYSRNTSYKP
jgi:hypothetical protein